MNKYRLTVSVRCPTCGAHEGQGCSDVDETIDEGRGSISRAFDDQHTARIKAAKKKRHSKEIP